MQISPETVGEMVFGMPVQSIQSVVPVCAFGENPLYLQIDWEENRKPILKRGHGALEATGKNAQEFIMECVFLCRMRMFFVPAGRN